MAEQDDIFETLDAVEWPAVTGGFPIPELLRGLADDARLDEALPELLHRLTPHGELEPVSELALPFLLRLACVSHPGREYVLRLVADLASGGNHGRHLTAGLRPSASTQPLAARLHDAVLAAYDALALGLDAADGGTRAASAVVLAMLPEHAQQTTVLLKRRAQDESEEMVRCAQLIGLGVSARASKDASVSEFLASLESQPDAQIFARLGAAMARALLAQDSLPQKVRDELGSAFQGINQPVYSFPWDAGHFRHHIAVLLFDTAVRLRDADLAAYVVRLGASVRAERLVVEAAFAVSMLGDLVDHGRRVDTPADLSESERWLLDRLVQSGALQGRGAVGLDVLPPGCVAGIDAVCAPPRQATP